MATGTTYSYNDSEYLFRLQTLIIDGGTTVLRNIVDQQLGNVSLNVFLANEKTKINRLRGQKIITTSQYDQLYPQGGQIPSITDFDITLITCLLRNLPSLGLNTHYRWTYQPQPTDLSTEADLIRLRGFRNEIAHITSTAACDQLTFQTKWDEIEQVLLRLNNGPKPLTNFQQTIDIYKNSSLDPAEEQRVQTKFKEWQELEKALESEINLVKEDMNTVKGDMTWVKEDVKDVKSDVDKVGKDLKTVKDEITLVKEDVKGIKSDNKDVKRAVEEVETKVNLIEEDVKGLTRGFEQDIKHGMIRKVERSKEEDKNVLEKHKDMNEKLDRALGGIEWKMSRMPNVHIDVPGVGIVIEVKNCSSDKQKEVLDILVKIFDEILEEKESSIQGDLTNDALHTIRKAVKQTFQDFLTKGRHIVKVELKCVLLTIKCASVSSFVDLIREYVTNNLEKQLKVLQSTFRSVFGCNELVFETSIFEDEVWKAIDTIVEVQGKQVRSEGYAVQPLLIHSGIPGTYQSPRTKVTGVGEVHFATSVQDTPNMEHAIRLRVHTPMPAHQKQLEDYFQTTAIETGVQGIQKEIGHQFAIDDMTSSTQLVKDEKSYEDHVPTDVQLTSLAGAIGQNWELLGPFLGLTRVEIDHIKMDNDTSAKKICKMLLTWKQENGEDATLAVLHKAMKEVKDLSIDWEAVPGLTMEEIKQCQEQRGESYTKLQDLQEDLVFLYRARHTTTSLSPLIKDDAPLLRFFMKPNIVKVEEERTPGDVKEKKTPLGQFRNIFKTTNDEPQCSTYLTADAGLGKTAYSKRLALAWCQAKKPLTKEAKYFSPEEIKVIGEFRFLFLVLLRYSPADKCQIYDLILKQIISQVNCRSDNIDRDLRNILAKEKCLIILDGLDEWSHPSTCTQRDNPIPHCVNRGNLTVLTTTRPWKLSIIGLKSSQIDQRLEIIGLNNESSNQLKLSVLSYFMCKRLEVSSLSDMDISKVKSDVEDFNTALEQKRLSSLEVVPLLLMYMLFLWHYKIDLGKTQCELYSNIVELLLSRTLETCESRDVQTSPENIPSYFSQLKQCSRFYTQLTALGRLAYETLLRETKLENSLVFDSSVAEKYVGKDCLEFCFKTGIVSQSEAVQIYPLQQNFKVSYSHKTVQEFFAAIYMSTVPDNIGIMAESVIQRCHCIQDILDMSKIFQFICGMNVKLAGLISRETRGIIYHDVITQGYRNTADRDYSRLPLEDLQDMFVLGCKEMPRENEVSLCLQDLFIGESCREKHYRESLRLLTTNKQNIKSVHIVMDHMRATPYNTVQDVLEYFTLNNLENVEKISCRGDIDDGFIPVLGSQVKCLRLWCSPPSYMSRSLFDTVRSLQKLEAIDIREFEMSHSELRLLYDYISQRVCMRKIGLGGLHCTDHEGSCRGPSLDLSQHSQLRELTLFDLPLSEFNIKMASLEICYLQELSIPALVLHPGSFGPANNKLNTSTVVLYEVRMAASVLTDLVNGVQALTQTVRVKMWGCKIETESEFETVKDQIKTSPYFKLLTIEKRRDLRGELFEILEFETIKGGLNTQHSTHITQSC